MIIPVKPANITQYFGENEAWYEKQIGLKGGHNGIDYGCECGTPVSAAEDGMVTFAGMDKSGYGKLIKIAHANYESLYAHLDKLGVTTGEKVKAGQVIGLSGYTGFVYPPGKAGAHLHFEIRVNGKAVDPMNYMAAASNSQAKTTTQEGEGIEKRDLAEIEPLALMTVDADVLNVRSGPGTEYKIIRQVSKGKKLPVYALAGAELWVMVGNSEWAALNWNGTALGHLERKG